MSQHSSFSAGGSGSQNKRNVLKRFERIKIMRQRRQWEEGRRLTGLPKTRVEG